MGITTSRRREVLERAGYACEDCHAPAPKGRTLWCGLDLHHKERNGNAADHDAENLVVACEECHMKRRHGKGSKPYGRRRQTTATDQAFLVKLPAEMLGQLYEQATIHRTSTRGVIEIACREWLAARSTTPPPGPAEEQAHE